ncbi:hypothetical protein IOD16_32305 [Saccharothrix sp. 6-C]|uniref:hypothetical protein n=1 Tax=Saccharothrix sp. 6-C TaxID=2781735 RepID=UPI0019173ACB|nr:hypothetical protein [Saccharothrix sp. 6-C]QQQ75713.1 hypothetical protein IOD16_32305 [Saccharothrix sp. 6-C]
MSEPQPGPFQPFVSVYQGTPGTGANWKHHFAQASLHRIRNSASVEEAQAQATTEAVVLLHSIRRILIWTLVIVPLVLVAVGVVVIVMAPGPDSNSLY